MNKFFSVIRFSFVWTALNPRNYLKRYGKSLQYESKNKFINNHQMLTTFTMFAFTFTNDNLLFEACK